MHSRHSFATTIANYAKSCKDGHRRPPVSLDAVLSLLTRSFTKKGKCLFWVGGKYGNMRCSSTIVGTVCPEIVAIAKYNTAFVTHDAASITPSYHTFAKIVGPPFY
jgi:hypothetical protein